MTDHDPQAAPDRPAPAGSALRRLGWVADRMAVLVLGLVAGFAVGLSFGGGTAPSPTPVAAPRAAIPATPKVAFPTTIDPRVAARLRRGAPLRVGVFGDSFGKGLWYGLRAQLPTEQGFEVLDFAREGRGFTRYQIEDLGALATQQVARQPIDAAVIGIGINDTQAIFAEGHLQPLLSPNWQRIIGDRVDRLVTTARSTGARVYWMGLPVVRDPALDATLQQIDALFAQHAQRLGVPFIDARRLSSDARGGYTAYLPAARTGKPALMRMPDGVHMIGVGYQRLTRSVADDLLRYRAQAAAAARR